MGHSNKILSDTELLVCRHHFDNKAIENYRGDSEVKARKMLYKLVY